MTEKRLDEDEEYTFCVIREGFTCSGYDRCGECAWQNMVLELEE